MTPLDRDTHTHRIDEGSDAVGIVRYMIPQFHETTLKPKDVICSIEIGGKLGIVESTMRSYASHRRMLNGRRMPDPVAAVGRRKVWLREDINMWITLARIDGLGIGSLLD